MESMELESLLQQAEQLSASIGGTEDFPRLEKNMWQILQNSSDLWTRTGAVGSTSSAKASVLLGAKGVDVGQMQSQLKRLEEVPVLETVSVEWTEEQDMECILRRERQRIVVGLIEETSRRVLEDSHRRHWDCMMRQWHTHKQNILNTLVASQDVMRDLSESTMGVHSQFDQHSDSSTTQMNLTRSNSSLLATPGGGKDRHVACQRNLTRLEMLYARQVACLNEKHVQQGTIPNAALMFKEVSLQSEDALTGEIWEMVSSVIQSLSSSQHPSSGSSLLSTLDCRLGEIGQSELVKTSLDYLHRRFKKYVQTLLFQQLSNTSLGGAPSVMKLAKAYLNTAFKSLPSSCSFEDGRVDGFPVWALVYVCLRLGDAESALEVAQRAPQGLGDLQPVLEEYYRNDSQLSYSTVVDLTLAYRRSVHKSSDLFKRVVYCVLGQCDVMESHSAICDSVEDYLWLKLSQVRRAVGLSSSFSSVSSASSADKQQLGSEVLSMDKLQTLIVDQYGTQLNNHLQPFLYFQVLWLCGLFEDSIEFLFRNQQLRCHAVHIALALLEQNLLIQSDSSGTSASGGQLITVKRYNQVQYKQLNFARLVMLYVKNFEKSNPAEALQYLFLLRNSQTISGVGGSVTAMDMSSPSCDNLFWQCVAELAMETRDYATLFGTRDFSDVRHGGLIDRLDPENSLAVIGRVASACERQGLLEDAVYLFDLAGQKDRSVDIVNRILVPLVPSVDNKGAARDRVVGIAVELAERYRKVGFVGNQTVLKTFYLLLDLVTFFDLFHSRNLDEAMEVAERLNLVPVVDQAVGIEGSGLGMGSADGGTGGSNESAQLERMLNNFASVSEQVKQCLPHTLLCCMKIIAAKYAKLANSGVSSTLPSGLTPASRSGGDKRRQLRIQARLLTTFVGRIPYTLPSHINSQLAQMELEMN